MHVHALAILAHEETKAFFSVKELDLAVRHSDSCLFSRALTRVKQALVYRERSAVEKGRRRHHSTGHLCAISKVHRVGFRVRRQCRHGASFF